jgi:hypothetical protein
MNTTEVSNHLARFIFIYFYSKECVHAWWNDRTSKPTILSFELVKNWKFSNRERKLYLSRWADDMGWACMGRDQGLSFQSREITQIDAGGRWKNVLCKGVVQTILLGFRSWAHRSTGRDKTLSWGKRKYQNCPRIHLQIPSPRKQQERSEKTWRPWLAIAIIDLQRAPSPPANSTSYFGDEAAYLPSKSTIIDRRIG